MKTEQTQASVVVLDHISVQVRDMKRARKFYERALGAIGMHVNMDFSPEAFGMGSKEENIFWLAHDKKAHGRGHYALRVGRRRDVDAFHRAALEAGGEENGEPGLRPDYGPNYYAAFVRDLEGNNIEVVCYAAETKAKTPSRAQSKTPRTGSSRRATRAKAGAAATEPAAKKRRASRKSTRTRSR